MKSPRRSKRFFLLFYPAVIIIQTGAFFLLVMYAKIKLQIQHGKEGLHARKLAEKKNEFASSLARFNDFLGTLDTPRFFFSLKGGDPSKVLTDNYACWVLGLKALLSLSVFIRAFNPLGLIPLVVIISESKWTVSCLELCGPFYIARKLFPDSSDTTTCAKSNTSARRTISSAGRAYFLQIFPDFIQSFCFLNFKLQGDNFSVFFFLSLFDFKLDSVLECTSSIISEPGLFFKTLPLYSGVSFCIIFI
jgi:hypothetical protein